LIPLLAARSLSFSPFLLVAIISRFHLSCLQMSTLSLLHTGLPLSCILHVLLFVVPFQKLEPLGEVVPHSEDFEGGFSFPATPAPSFLSPSTSLSRSLQRLTTSLWSQSRVSDSSVFPWSPSLRLTFFRLLPFSACVEQSFRSITGNASQSKVSTELLLYGTKRVLNRGVNRQVSRRAKMLGLIMSEAKHGCEYAPLYRDDLESQK
jgi:hypothetical protein